MAQFRELQAFSQFGSDLDKATQAQLARGQRLTEILKQPQYQPMDVEKQMLVIWAATNGYIDDIAIENVRRFETGSSKVCRELAPGSAGRLSAEQKTLTDEIKKDLKQVLEDFKESWKRSAQPRQVHNSAAAQPTA